MYNDELAGDYLRRAGSRLKALDVLMGEQSWADVVQESQEIVEITLKALLRRCRIEVPRIHDVSPVIEENLPRIPEPIRDRLEEITGISRSLGEGRPRAG